MRCQQQYQPYLRDHFSFDAHPSEPHIIQLIIGSFFGIYVMFALIRGLFEWIDESVDLHQIPVLIKKAVVFAVLVVKEFTLFAVDKYLAFREYLYSFFPDSYWWWNFVNFALVTLCMIGIIVLSLPPRRRFPPDNDDWQ